MKIYFQKQRHLVGNYTKMTYKIYSQRKLKVVKLVSLIMHQDISVLVPSIHTKKISKLWLRVCIRIHKHQLVIVLKN